MSQSPSFTAAPTICSSPGAIGILGSDLIRFSAVELQRLFDTGVIGAPLASPYKQIFHLLGLILCTPADNPEHVTEDRWKEILDSLNEVTHSYASAYFPKPEDPDRGSAEGDGCCDANVPELLQHAAPSISGTVEEQVQKSLDATWDAREVADRERHRFLDEAEAKNLTLEQMREAAKTDPVGPAHHQYFRSTERMFVIDVALLKRQFGENDAEFFLQLLSATRRQFKDYFYPTEENPAELHPLLFAESDELFCPAPRVLLLALLRRCEEILKKSPKSAS